MQTDKSKIFSKKLLTFFSKRGIITKLSETHERQPPEKSLKKLKKLSKNLLTNRFKCGKMVKRFTREGADGSLKIEQ